MCGNMCGCPVCPVARYARLPGCPAARKYARLPGNMPGCPEICPVARKYVRLPGNMPGCPVCPAVRKYARLSGNMPGMFGSPTSALRLRLDAQRLLSAAPLAASTDRHERWHATMPHDHAQLRGRASGVRCKAMLGCAALNIQEKHR